MGIKTSPWDAAEVLTTPERQAAYLEAAAEGGDLAHFLEALGTVARAAGMAKVSKAAGLNRESLYKALRGSGKPSFHTVSKVIGSMGLRFTFAPTGRQTSRKANEKRPLKAA